MRLSPFHHRAFAAAALAAATMTAAACGGSTTSTAAHLVTSTPVNALPAAHGDIANLTWDLTQGEPATLDPVQALDFSSWLVVAQMCDTLLRENPDMSLSPNLVTAKQASPISVILTLRSGVKFWDGNPVTVDDVVYSLKRNLNPKRPGVFYLPACQDDYGDRQ